MKRVASLHTPLILFGAAWLTGNGHYVYSGDRGMLASHALGRSGPHYTDMEEDYAEVKAFLVELDLAKKLP